MALALKYRPRSIDDVTGQRHVTTILSRLLLRWSADEIELPAGFLFAGNKGSGKTSTARIVAAAVNCDGFREGVIPCGECDTCRDIAKQSLPPFIHEFDAATHGRIEDVRQIKEIARLHHSGKTRVIIMDECHALTKEAWSAMLKQLEEPHQNVLYIFVTTDPQRIPDTIISRLLVFQFFPIANEDVVSRLQHVCEQETYKPDEGVLELIAARSGGALRDALMSLEQLAIADSGFITKTRFKELWPLDSESYAEGFFKAAMAGDLTAALELNQTIMLVSRDSGVLADALIDYLTAAMLDKTHPLVGSAPIIIGFVWDLRIRMRQVPGNSTSMLDMLFVQITNYLTGRADMAPKPMILTANGVVPCSESATADDLAQIFN